MKKFPVWILSGQAVNAYKSKGENYVKDRPWKAGVFETGKEADAFKEGMKAAITASLRSVAFIDEQSALRIEARMVEVLKQKYPALDIKAQSGTTNGDNES